MRMLELPWAVYKLYYNGSTYLVAGFNSRQRALDWINYQSTISKDHYILKKTEYFDITSLIQNKDEAETTNN